MRGQKREERNVMQSVKIFWLISVNKFLIQFLQEIKVMNSTKWEDFCKKFHFDFRTTLFSSLSCFKSNVLQIVNSTKWESFPFINLCLLDRHYPLVKLPY